ncbi:MAG: SDR family oxidoreductase [Deltaproteobacteria bacterium]
MTHLSDKRAFVTGGSRGIGAGIVRTLAAAGADIAFTYRARADAAEGVAREVRDLGRRVTTVKADSADPEALVGAVDHAARALGHIDIFVSSAGVLLFKPIEEFSLDDFEHVVAVDLRAAFVGAKAILPHMRSGGRIIFISSNIADYAALPMTSLYSMVKSGLDGLMKGMARDLGPRGITVNTVHPGPIATDANPADGEYSKPLKALMATPKFGSPADVGSLVAYLASDEASFISGSQHRVDNGFTA